MRDVLEVPVPLTALALLRLQSVWENAAFPPVSACASPSRPAARRWPCHGLQAARDTICCGPTTRCTPAPGQVISVDVAQIT